MNFDHNWPSSFGCERESYVKGQNMTLTSCTHRSSYTHQDSCEYQFLCLDLLNIP